MINLSRRHGMFALAAALGAGWSSLALAAGAVNLNAEGVAIKGYDPVAYFTQGKPVQGTAARALTVGGATYWFASDAHRDAFQAAPEKYQPQYGGYCAFGVSQGFKPDIDPTAFRVVDGKLYLNLSPAVQARWVLDIPGYITQADKHWPGLKNK